MISNFKQKVYINQRSKVNFPNWKHYVVPKLYSILLIVTSFAFDSCIFEDSFLIAK